MDEVTYPEVEEARKKYCKEKDWFAHQIIDSYCKNKRLAEAIGCEALASLVPASKDKLDAAYRDEDSLNEIPLKKWDAMHPRVLDMRRHARISKDGKFGWSLSNSVSLLKWVAKHHILGKTLEESIRWSHLQFRLEANRRVRKLPE